MSAWSSTAQSDQVTVSAIEGTFTLRGEVHGFDGRYLRLQTRAGEITLDYAGVICAGADCPDAGSYVPELVFSGAGQILDRLLPPLIAAYGRTRNWEVRSVGPRRELWPAGAERPALAISVLHRTSDEGLADLVSGEADLAVTDRALSPDVRARAREAGLGDLARGDQTRILALDAVVPIVAPRRDVHDIRLQTLTDVIEGRARNWSALGLATEPLAGMVPADPFLPLPGTPYGIDRRPVTEIPGAVLASQTSLGVVPFGGWGNARPLSISGPCGRPIEASTVGLKTGDYPLTRPIFLFRPSRRLSDAGQDFLVWLRSREAQGVIRRAGFVDLAADRIAIGDQGERLAAAIAAAGPEIGLGELQRLVRILSGHDRLTPTFRFADGSTRLAPQSRSYLLQLARAIREGQYDGDSLVLVGFSDGRGPALVNRELSRARAEAVRRALVLALGGFLPEGVTVTTEAFGEALPIACDEVVWGQNINRRVELWIARRRG